MLCSYIKKSEKTKIWAFAFWAKQRIESLFSTVSLACVQPPPPLKQNRVERYLCRIIVNRVSQQVLWFLVLTEF